MKKNRLEQRDKARGQSLIEIALLFPVLLIVLSGLIEYGFILNEYLAVMDASRNAARFSADSLYTSSDNNHNCDPHLGTVTVDFYRQTACVVLDEIQQERPNIELDYDAGDDIVVSVFRVDMSGGTIERLPSAYGESGWSYKEDLGLGSRRASGFSSNEVMTKLMEGSASAPNSGVLLVEVYYSYDQKLKLPWITAFLADPVQMHVYSFMPLSSAEPR